jgi:hypothetical protein
MAFMTLSSEKRRAPFVLGYRRHNQSMQRMGASRLAHLQIVSPWRLAPTADARR